MFQNGKVVILTDESACSEGDEFPHYFGLNHNRNIGANTRVVIVGQNDCRIRGGSSCGFVAEGLPVYSDFLKDSQGKSLCAMPRSRIENGGLGFVEVGKDRFATQTAYTAPDILLPENPKVYGKTFRRTWTVKCGEINGSRLRYSIAIN